MCIKEILHITFNIMGNIFFEGVLWTFSHVLQLVPQQIFIRSIIFVWKVHNCFRNNRIILFKSLKSSFNITITLNINSSFDLCCIKATIKSIMEVWNKNTKMKNPEYIPLKPRTASYNIPNSILPLCKRLIQLIRCSLSLLATF